MSIFLTTSTPNALRSELKIDLLSVANDAARFALTASEAPVGRFIQVVETNNVYVSIDTSNLGNENGYVVLPSAGPATIIVRSGTQTEVDAVTPEDNELIFATDTENLYIGKGGAKVLLNGAGGSGFSVSDASGASGEIAGKISISTTLEPNDGLQVAGDARGAGSIDLQIQRQNATEVASGAQSVLIGGAGNTAAGTQSLVVGGSSNNASADSVVIIGGNSNSVTDPAGGYATIIGGQSCTATKTQTVLSGTSARGNLDGLRSHGMLTAVPVELISIGYHILTSGTAPDICVDSSGNGFSIEEGEIVSGILHCSAVRDDIVSNVQHFVKRFTLVRAYGGNIVLSENSVLGTDLTSGGATCVLSVDTGTQQLVITVTGVTGATLYWSATIQAQRMLIPAP